MVWPTQQRWLTVGQLIRGKQRGTVAWALPWQATAPPHGPAGVSALSLCPPGVFLPQAPAAANEPVLEELGILTLAPLADVLCSPQPSPAAAPIVSPLTGPLNSLLPGPGSVSQSSPLTGLLSGHLAGPVAVSPGGMLASSLGLPSAGPMPLGSPLMGPVAGSVAVSLGSPLLTSTAAPLGISQNLLATPLSNLVLPEAPRGPQPFAGAGPAAQGKRRGGGGPGRVRRPASLSPSSSPPCHPPHLQSPCPRSIPGWPRTWIPSA